MGWFSHICEAEFTFDPSLSIEDIKNKLKEQIASKSKEYTLIDDTAATNQLFKRAGEKHEVKHAYRNGAISHDDLTLYCIHTSKLFKFIDDIAFTFVMEEENGGNGKDEKKGVVMRALSISRVGEGDMFQNQKNIRQLVDPLNPTNSTFIRA